MPNAEPETPTSHLDDAHREWIEKGDDRRYPVPTDDVPELDDRASALDAYMARLGNLEPLSDAQQNELARRYRDDDCEAAGDLLVMTNLRFVIGLARDFTNDWDKVLDLVQEGNVGMSKALGRYEPSRDVKFTSYARYWIRARIFDYLINRGRTIRLGSSRAGRKLFYNLNEVREDLRDRGVEPTPDRVAEELDVDVEDVVRVGNQIDAAPVSLDEKVGEGASDTFGDLLESDVSTPEQAVARRERREAAREALEAFGDQLDDERRCAIWDDRIVAIEPKYLADLGDEWGVTEERIRQIECDLHTDFQIYFREWVGSRSEMETLLA